MDLAERHKQRFADQYKIVRFETLVTKPEETLREICDFLDEPFLPEMLRMDGAPKHQARLLNGRTLSPGQTPVSADYIGLYKQKVPKLELAFMQHNAGRKMQTYGYEMEPLHFNKTEKLRFTFIEQPGQLLRMATWRSVEALQQNFPRRFGRKPGRRMIIDAPLNSTNKLKAT